MGAAYDPTILLDTPQEFRLEVQGIHPVLEPEGTVGSGKITG